MACPQAGGTAQCSALFGVRFLEYLSHPPLDYIESLGPSVVPAQPDSEAEDNDGRLDTAEDPVALELHQDWVEGVRSRRRRGASVRPPSPDRPQSGRTCARRG